MDAGLSGEQVAAIGLLVPVVVGLVEVIKRTELVNSTRYAGVIAVALAIVLAVGYGFTFASERPLEYVFPGIISGLMAAGVYSAGRSASGK